MCLERAQHSVSQELPGGAPPAATSMFAQGQGSPGGQDWLEDATQAAPSGPHADHSLAFSPARPCVWGIHWLVD